VRLRVLALTLAVTLVGCGSSAGDPAGPRSTDARATTPATVAAGADPCAPGAAAPPSRVPGAALDTILRVPAGARGHRAPLVLGLHFASGTGAEMERRSRLTPEARKAGFVVAYPSASESHFWDDQRDEDRLLATIDAIERVACIDPRRIDVVGISNGGFMATVLACRHADRIAGAALFAPGIGGDACEPARPVPVIEIHGTADPIVPYRDVPAFVAGWARRDGCAAASQREPAGRGVVRFRWPGCRGGARVEHLRLTGGRHIELLPELRAAGVDPAATVWRFLAPARVDAR
jgi:polyhydroxybutyrate depolymerase